MATSTQLKFYKFSKSTESADKIRSAKYTAGALVYVTDKNELWAGGTAPELLIKGCSNVSFANNVLTIAKADGTSQTLDFSDVASASSTLNVFEHINSLIGTTVKSGTTGLDYSDTNYLKEKTNLVAADKELDTQIKTVNNRIDGLDVNAYEQGSIQNGVITIKGIKETAGIISGENTGKDVTIAYDGTYDASNNKLATQSTVKTAIEALDVTEYAQGGVTTDAITIKSIKEVDGKIEAGTTNVTIAIADSYDATDNKLATQTTVTSALSSLTGTATIATKDATGIVTLKAGVIQTNGVISNSTVTDVVLAKVATTAESEDVYKTSTSTATYNTTSSEVSSTWVSVVNANKLNDGDTVDADLTKLDVKIAGLADELIADEKVINTTFGKIKDTIGAETDYSINFTGTNYIYGATTVKTALTTLDSTIKANEITIDGQVGTITSGNGLNVISSTTKTMSVKANTNAYIKVNSDGVGVDHVASSYSTSTSTSTDLATIKTVTEAIETLDVTNQQAVAYTAATDNAGAILTFKGIVETDGKIAQGDGTTTLQFAKVATTGSASDVSVTYPGTTATNVQSAVTNIDSRITELEKLPGFDVIVSTTASNTPEGVKWTQAGGAEITGTLVASEGTMRKIYLVPTGSGTDAYAEYITIKTGTEGSYSYSWEKIGNTSVDLKGYVKTVTVNGKSYAVENSTSTNITLREDYVTGVTGEASSDLNNTTYVNIKATTTSSATDGTNNVSLVSSVKIQDVSSAESTTAMGLAEASDVKSYVDEKIDDLGATVSSTGNTNVAVVVTEENGVITDVAVTESYATVTRTAKSSGVAPALTVTNTSQLAVGADIEKVKLYADDKVAYEIEQLDADKTSDDASVATVEVKELDGKINDVIVTTIGAGVTGSSTTLTATTATGAVVGSDIATIKTYIDGKVGTAVQSVTVTSTETSKIVTQDSHVIVKVTAATDDDHNVKLSSEAQLNMATINAETGAVTIDGIVTANNVSTMFKSLDADKTSDDAAVATVEVKEVDGKISDVVVTTNSAGVTYTAATGASTPAALSASTGTGAVTGADITAIKNYIDAQDAKATTTVTAAADSGITVSSTTDSSDYHKIYTIGFVWEEYE